MVHELLIVEDESEVRELLEEILTDAGVKVTTAVNGRDALEKIHSQNFYAVLCDLNMPEMGGLELIEALRRESSLLPVVVLSAFQDVERMQSALRLGAFDYLIKPFNTQELIAVAYKAIEVGSRRWAMKRRDIGGAVNPIEAPRVEQAEKFVSLLQIANNRRKSI